MASGLRKRLADPTRHFFGLAKLPFETVRDTRGGTGLGQGYRRSSSNEGAGGLSPQAGPGADLG